MLNKSINEWRDDYLEKLRVVDYSLVGIGVTAFSRISPAFIFPDYQIFCFRNSSDLEYLRKFCPIYSLEEKGFESLRKWNSLSLIRHSEFEKYINNLNRKPAVCLYKTSKKIWKRLKEMDVKVIANAPDVRDVYEEKRKFFEIGRKIGLPMISGEQWAIDELSKEKFMQVRSRLGEKLVFQLTDITLGGGKGTFFINTVEDFEEYNRFLVKEREKRNLKWVNITKFISGPSLSITGCATKYGILSGVVQTQVVDIPELSRGLGSRRGVYQGHDWSYGKYGSEIQFQAEDIVERLGEYMYIRGYKGVFGVDLVIEEKTGKVFLVECNSRYTGAFPVYSMLQQSEGEIPLGVFQLMEFLEIDYEMDFDLINSSWKSIKKGAHLVISNPYQGEWKRIGGDLSSGVYKYDGELGRVRDGATYLDLKNDDEIVLTDGFPKKGQKIKPGLRIGKIIFKRGVLDSPSSLNNFSKNIIEEVYQKLSFEVIKI